MKKSGKQFGCRIVSAGLLRPLAGGLILALWAIQPAWPDVASGRRGAVATVQPLATEAGIAAMEAGGNAVDAAIAAALTLGVVDNHNSCFGGGCFIVIHTSAGKLIAIDGREMAPAKATRDMFLDAARRLGKPATELSTTGPLAVGTPGALAAYVQALDAHGRLKLPDLLRPAAEIAARGFPIDARFAANLRSVAPAIRQFPGARAILLKEDGSPYDAGEILRQTDLARTYRMIASHGPDWFYRGELADRVGTWMAENGGVLAAGDFAAYRAISREPVVTTYRGHRIVGMPPPSSGGIHVAQILNILEHFDLKSLHADDPAKFTHVVAEAMKLAFADRAHWLGDSDYASVPRGLVGKAYAAQLAKRIDLDRATAVQGHGVPPGSDMDFFDATKSSRSLTNFADNGRSLTSCAENSRSLTSCGEVDTAHDSPNRRRGLSARGYRGRPLSATEKHTTHIAAADSEGNWVAITATVNTTFGSKVIVPGTGLVLNNQMDDFSIAPGVPNAFGLIGAEANEIAPGKRPLSSMSPTIVLVDGRPVLTCGAAGGPKIITQVVLTIVRAVDLGMPLDQAVASPRFHHQWVPRRLMFEKSFAADLPWALAGRGHTVSQLPSAGVLQAIARPTTDGPLTAVADPRVPGKAAGR